MPRVSDYVPQIVAYIAQIQANGLAYESAGSVYFDTTAFECALLKLLPPGVARISVWVLRSQTTSCSRVRKGFKRHALAAGQYQ